LLRYAPQKAPHASGYKKGILIVVEEEEQLSPISPSRYGAPEDRLRLMLQAGMKSAFLRGLDVGGVFCPYAV